MKDVMKEFMSGLLYLGLLFIVGLVCSMCSGIHVG